MSTIERSTTPPKPAPDGDVDMENGAPNTTPKPDAKVIIVTNLSRNVVEVHLQSIFSHYGKIAKIDLPLFGKSGQNRGKAALEFVDPPAAHTAASHMDGGQLDGQVLKVELSELPIRTRSRSPRPRRPRSFSRSRSRSPLAPRRRGFREEPRYDSYRGGGGGRGGFGSRRGPPVRDSYRPYSRSRSRSPVRRTERLGPRRRSPSYERGGTGYGRGRRTSRSRSYSVRSSRSRTRSLSRSRSRSASYSSYSRYSRSRSRSVSGSRGKRSLSRDDIRDSRSRSPPPPKDK